MKIIYFFFYKKTLYATTNALMAAGKTRSNIDNAVAQKSKAIAACKLLELGKSNYFKWDDMSNGWRASVEAKFGNPYHFIGKQPILDMLVEDLEAAKFYLAYRYGNEKALSTKKIKQYTRAASWLVMVHNAQQNNNAIIKKQLQMSIPQFFDNCKLLIEKEIKNGKNDDYAYNDELTKGFASSYQRLKTNAATFKEKGFEFLIDDMLDNNRSAKINDAISLNYLKALIEHPYQYDDVLLCYMYNKWADENGYKKIEPQTVGNYRREFGFELDATRYGKSYANSKYIKSVKGFTPTQPLFLVESDDYNLNTYFQNEFKSLYARYVAYVVADSSLGLVLGKSYKVAKAPTYDMVLEAWVDAMYYIKNLVDDGNWYLPFEVKADHWQKGKAFDFFKSIGNFIAPALHNKQRGYIEPLFGSPHFKRAEKLAAHKQLNYKGNNVTAAHTGVNVELIKQYEKARPFIGKESVEQVERFFYYAQKLPSITAKNMDAPSREQQWLQNFNTLSIEDKRPITDEQFLLLFGTKHLPQGRPISITRRGIEPQINNVQYSYDLPNHNGMMHLIGSKVTVVYDERDMSRVLITNFEDIRFIAQDANYQSRALKDATEGSRTQLNKVLEEKKAAWATIDKKAKDRKELMLEDIDPEAIIFGGMMPKEMKAAVEQAYIESESNYEEVEQKFSVAQKRLQRN
jgi:hypothetical protein